MTKIFTSLKLTSVNIVTVHLKNARYGYNVPIDRRQESADNYEGEQHRVKEVTCILDHTVRKTKNPDKELWIMAGDFNSYSGKDNYIPITILS